MLANKNTQRLVDQFMAMAKIASPSRQEGRLAAYLKPELEALGFVVEFDSAGELAGGDTGNLIATLPGDPDIEPLVLSCHMDTVTPCIGVTPIVEDGVIRSDGTTVLGGDDKAGIAAILEGVRRIRERGVRHGLIQAVFTICEEVGMHGAMGLDYSKIRAKRAFILDADGPIGQILVRGPAKDAIHAVIHGRSAHAGLKPEAGISAIQVAARAIERMKLLRIDDETTANLGQISGGGATNIVTDRVEITAEARSLTNEKLDAQGAHMKACLEDAAHEFGATAEVTIERSYHAFSLDADEPVVRHCVAAMQSLGITPTLASTGGGSDCNVFNRHGMKAVDLSIGMTDVHTCMESLRIEDLEMTARLVEALIEFSDRTSLPKA
ncbi:MAG: M20/M25/M40 family metallo-hydrolase [Propionivibrio sp.]|uniref:M20/M25/M40 family metallo-hydrolase n=1 Tax=Propionivibrio sp. TaxID=2212460 RepID=UPI001B62B961|nr:M20/M25/M40 family metallo-hydrolase [Propionivibrio sp.]MBP7202331.1 M20/M25/M40 family metallo-hydrolase [Propionivibrio sp.]